MKTKRHTYGYLASAILAVGLAGGCSNDQQQRPILYGTSGNRSVTAPAVASGSGDHLPGQNEATMGAAAYNGAGSNGTGANDAAANAPVVGNSQASGVAASGAVAAPGAAAGANGTVANGSTVVADQTVSGQTNPSGARPREPMAQPDRTTTPVLRPAGRPSATRTAPTQAAAS